MARNARAHTEQIVAADPEIQGEYETLRLRRAIIARLRAIRERRRWTQLQFAGRPFRLGSIRREDRPRSSAVLPTERPGPPAGWTADPG